MTYRGRIKNGVVVFEGDVPLPEGTEVRVEAVEPAGGKTLADRFRDVIGSISDLPADMARNHDHYIHGAAKE